MACDPIEPDDGMGIASSGQRQRDRRAMVATMSTPSGGADWVRGAAPTVPVWYLETLGGERVGAPSWFDSPGPIRLSAQAIADARGVRILVCDAEDTCIETVYPKVEYVPLAEQLREQDNAVLRAHADAARRDMVAAI